LQCSPCLSTVNDFVDPGTQIHQFDSLRFGHGDAATRAAEQSQVGGRSGGPPDDCQVMPPTQIRRVLPFAWVGLRAPAVPSVVGR
jgi:hypothetical protein